MSITDWRLPGTYEDLRSLDAPGLAWEFLRRNPSFIQDARELHRDALKGTTKRAYLDAFVQRWGLRILGEAPADQARQDSLGARRPTKRCCSNYNCSRSG
jgi:hypothetical protein